VPVAVATIADLQGHLGLLLADVLLRENTERRANAAARLIAEALKCIDASDVQTRLEMIEERLAAIERIR
jgi:hypothetical protein